MEAAAGLIKLKPNSEATVANWKTVLQARKEEALATLRDEGVQVESWFEVDIAGEQYLLWYMRAESIAQAWQVAMASKHDIDAYHFQVMADITAPDGEITAKPILDFHRGESADLSREKRAVE